MVDERPDGGKRSEVQQQGRRISPEYLVALLDFVSGNHPIISCIELLLIVLAILFMVFFHGRFIVVLRRFRLQHHHRCAAQRTKMQMIVNDANHKRQVTGIL
jgi:hypothetical protein